MITNVLQKLLHRHPNFEERLAITSDMDLEQYRRAISNGKPSIDTIIKQAQTMSSTETLLVAALVSSCDYAWATQQIVPNFWQLWNLLDEEQTQIVIDLLQSNAR